MVKQIKEEKIILKYYCDACEKEAIMLHKIGKKEFCKKCFDKEQKNCIHIFDLKAIKYKKSLEPTCSRNYCDDLEHCGIDCWILTITREQQCEICHIFKREEIADLEFNDLIFNENIMKEVYKEFNIK